MEILFTTDLALDIEISPIDSFFFVTSLNVEEGH